MASVGVAARIEGNDAGCVGIDTRDCEAPARFAGVAVHEACFDARD
jgi:hypothetical protein